MKKHRKLFAILCLISLLFQSLAFSVSASGQNASETPFVSFDSTTIGIHNEESDEGNNAGIEEESDFSFITILENDNYQINVSLRD